MTGLFVVAVYVGIFVASFFIITKVVARATTKDFTSLKTVTFGDESAVHADRIASAGPGKKSAVTTGARSSARRYTAASSPVEASTRAWASPLGRRGRRTCASSDMPSLHAQPAP